MNIDTKEIKSGNFPGGFSYGEYAAWSSDSTKIYSVEGALYGDEPSKVTELYSDLVIWDIFTNSKQVFKTVNYREVDSN